jgi:hypothetical protein
MTSPTKCSLALAMLATLAGGAAQAAVIHVPGDHATIGAALAAAAAGDEVQVDPGLYLESDLFLPPDVGLRGLGDAEYDPVIIDAEGAGRVLMVGGGTARLENVTLRHGAADQGGGLFLESGTPEIVAVVLASCTANLGGGLFVSAAEPTIEGCRFLGNDARSLGGGVHAVDTPAIELVDCLFHENSAGAAGGAWYTARSGLAISGCTVVGNRAPLGAEGCSFGGSATTITSTIAVDNHAGDASWTAEQILLSDDAGQALNTCTLRWQPGWLGYLADQLDGATGNLEADPLFCYNDGGGLPGTFGLAANSPALPDENPYCDAIIGAFGIACGPVAAPDTPAVRTVLHPAFPNPFNPETTIRYETAQAGRVVLAVYGLDGRRVATLVDENRAAGMHQTSWFGRDDRGRSVASGVYLCRLVAGRTRTAIRLTLVK